VAAVIVAFAVSGNPRLGGGSEAGSLLVASNLAPCLLFIAVFMLLILTRPGLSRLFRDKPALALPNLLFFCCAGYAIFRAGPGGAATHVASYLSAGLLAYVFDSATVSQKHFLARCIVGFCGCSLVMGIGEGIFRIASASPLIGDANIRDLTSEADYLPGEGLFANPSTAMLVNCMAAVLLMRMPVAILLKSALVAAVLAASLGSAGTEAAALGLIVLLATAVLALTHGLVMRTLRLQLVAVAGAAVVMLPPLIFLLLPHSGAGEQIFGHIALDTGSMIPQTQWIVLRHLSLPDILYGVSPARLDVLKLQIGLGQNPAAIDNLWLRMFLDLGAIFAAMLFCGLTLLLLHLGRSAEHPLGWLLLAAAVIDAAGRSDDTSEVDFLALVACMIAMSGYTHVAAIAAPPRTVLHRLRRRPETGMIERVSSGRLTHANLAGHQP
jgi:hypothetical protein